MEDRILFLKLLVQKIKHQRREEESLKTHRQWGRFRDEPYAKAWGKGYENRQKRTPVTTLDDGPNVVGWDVGHHLEEGYILMCLSGDKVKEEENNAERSVSHEYRVSS